MNNRIAQLISASSDADRVAQYFGAFASQHPAILADLSSEPDRLLWLASIFRLSRFLSDECLRHPDWIWEIADLDRPYSVSEYRSRLADFLGGKSVTALGVAMFRRKELLRIVVRDALALATVGHLTEEISSLADAILGRALESVTADLTRRYGSPLTRDEYGALTNGLFTVIALGKLGGRELNYSSDVDLMFVYSDNGETTGPHIITNVEFFKKVANQFTNLLSTYTAAGVCYRVDLRLRPEGSLGEICLSLTGAKDYYAKRARDWELQMLIKARVSAGDEDLGRQLLEFLEPFTYSTTLDFTAIETMSDTRERIGEKLARKRCRLDRLDVKLARGGIRDIEFLVQCLQRLHGSRDLSVRHGGTLFALSSLLEKDLLSESEHARLAGAYQFLRHLEHRLQLEDDRQTHALPSDARELERIALRMPASGNAHPAIGSSAQLLQMLNQHLENVQVIYERIVHAQRPLYYTPSIAVIPFNAPIAAPMEKRAEKPRSRTATNQVIESVERLTPNFAALARSHGFRRPESSLESFVEGLSKDSCYVRLIETHPLVARYALRILELSPFLSEQMTRNPAFLEEIRRIADYPAMRPAFEGLAAPLYDIGGLRRFFQHEMFRILTGSICLPESVFQTLDRLSGLAEFLIARAYRIALEQDLEHARAHGGPFPNPQEQMMVVALGRLGMREFDLGSDADVLFIIPDSEQPRQQFWTRVAEHVIVILTDYGVDGPILSLDTRLRPNGREGVLVQTESNYFEYFAKHAEAWEGIAYMKARGVAGDLERATEFLTQLQQVDWRRYGQSGRSRQDLRQMRMRLQREQGALTPLKASEGGYYDADFILMYLRLRGAGLFYKSLNTPERIDVVEKMGHLERADAEFLLDATTFLRAIDHAVRIVSGRAEERLPASLAEREMVADLVGLWSPKRPAAATLDQELSALQQRLRRLFDGIFH